MPENVKKYVVGVLTALGGLGIAVGIDIDAASQGAVVDALSNVWVAVGAAGVTLAAIVAKFTD